MSLRPLRSTCWHAAFLRGVQVRPAACAVGPAKVGETNVPKRRRRREAPARPEPISARCRPAHEAHAGFDAPEAAIAARCGGPPPGANRRRDAADAPPPGPAGVGRPPCAATRPGGRRAHGGRGQPAPPSELAAELVEAHRLPALLRGHARELRVGVDGDGVPHRPQHREVRLRVGVGVGQAQVQSLALGELGHPHRLALAVVEGLDDRAGVGAVTALLEAGADRPVEAEHGGQQHRQVVGCRRGDVDRPARILVPVGDLHHLGIHAGQDAGHHLRGHAAEVAHPRPVEQLVGLLAHPLGALVGRAAKTEVQALGRHPGHLAPGEHAGAAGRPGPVEPGRSGDQRAVEVEERGRAQRRPGTDAVGLLRGRVRHRAIPAAGRAG